MNYQRFIEGQTFVVRWREPTVEAAGRLADELERLHERLGEPLMLAILIGPDCPPPDARTSEALLEGHDRIYDCCIGVRMVFIGGSIRQTLMRSVMAGITLATGLRGKGFAVDKSVAALAKVIQSATRLWPIDLVRGLEQAGMLEPDEVAQALEDLG